MTSSNSTDPKTIFKVASREVFEASRAEGRFTGMPIDGQDGYIHLSTARQLRETLRLHFAGQAGLVLFAVPVGAVRDSLKWEPSRGGELFPHVYGTLPMDVIGSQATISVAADGRVDLPEWAQ